jgi:hypothetical protein
VLPAGLIHDGVGDEFAPAPYGGSPNLADQLVDTASWAVAGGGATYADLAVALGISEEAARSRWSGAARHLNGCWGDAVSELEAAAVDVDQVRDNRPEGQCFQMTASTVQLAPHATPIAVAATAWSCIATSTIAAKLARVSAVRTITLE